MKLILMYVYYDKNGDIRAISPSEDETLTVNCNHILLPLAEVEDFILGRKNAFDYVIKKVEKVSGDTMALAKKFSNVKFTRSMDTYLTKIGSTAKSVPVVKVILNTVMKKITLILNQSYKDMYEFGSEEERERIDDFVMAGVSSIHLTEKNNPYKLYKTISFLPRELFDKLRLDFKYDETLDLSNSSAYTKRLVNSYQFIIKDNQDAL